MPTKCRANLGKDYSDTACIVHPKLYFRLSNFFTHLEKVSLAFKLLSFELKQTFFHCSLAACSDFCSLSLLVYLLAASATCLNVAVG